VWTRPAFERWAAVLNGALVGASLSQFAQSIARLTLQIGPGAYGREVIIIARVSMNSCREDDEIIADQKQRFEPNPRHAPPLCLNSGISKVRPGLPFQT
jgi:hypothetical protein